MTDQRQTEKPSKPTELEIIGWRGHYAVSLGGVITGPEHRTKGQAESYIKRRAHVVAAQFIAALSKAEATHD